MHKLTNIAVAALVAGCLSGCGASGKGSEYKSKPAEKVPVASVEGREADLFPAKKDNTWVYESTSTQATARGTQSKDSEVTFKITDVRETPEGKYVDIEVTTNREVGDKLTWLIGKDGIYESVSSYRKKVDQPLISVEYKPAVPVLPFPAKENTVVNVSSNGVRPMSIPGPFEGKVKILGVQEVDTASGRMSALCSEQRSEYETPSADGKSKLKVRSVSTAFWAPNIGIVRYIQDVSVADDKGNAQSFQSLLRLKSHQP